MTVPLRILGISGSLRQASFNRAALRAAQTLLPGGVHLDIAEIGSLPLFNQDIESPLPPDVVSFKAQVSAADAILISTAEYNGSIPGVLKNAFDWGSRPYTDNSWNGKPLALMGASMGMLGTARAQDHLRQVAVFLNMYPLNKPNILIATAQQKFAADGSLTDPKTLEQIRKLIAALVDWTRFLSASRP